MNHRVQDFKGSPEDATCAFNVWAKVMEQKDPNFEIKNVAIATYEDREDNYLITSIVAYYTK